MQSIPNPLSPDVSLTLTHGKAERPTAQRTHPSLGEGRFRRQHTRCTTGMPS